MGVLNAGSLIAFTQAMKEAPTTVVMPLDFLRLIWMATFGYLFYVEVPDTFTLLGGAFIFTGALLVAMVERFKRPLYDT
jgi:drug/metabolite transporter (DMT)-like permease